MQGVIMVLAIVTQITFAATEHRQELVIRLVNGVTTDSTWERQTDTATIFLPRNVLGVKGYFKDEVKSLFRRKDPVKIEVGFNGDLRTEFEGYISEAPTADIPVKIKCEDEMWILKQKPANISMKDTTLPKLMAKLLPDYEVDALEMDLGSVRFSNSTVAKVLAELKSKFGLPSYFQNGKLVVGKIYADNTDTYTVDLEGSQVAENKLRYINAEDRSIKVVAVSTLTDGKKKKAEYGDEGGELRQLPFFNITDEAKLKELAKLEYDKYKVDGFEGYLVCFDVPAKHGDKLELKSATYPDREGTYYVDRRKVKMDDSPRNHTYLYVGPKATT